MVRRDICPACGGSKLAEFDESRHRTSPSGDTRDYYTVPMLRCDECTESFEGPLTADVERDKGAGVLE